MILNYVACKFVTTVQPVKILSKVLKLKSTYNPGCKQLLKLHAKWLKISSGLGKRAM